MGSMTDDASVVSLVSKQSELSMMQLAMVD
jgi:hypothetical protein